MNKNIKNYVRMVILSTIFLVFFMASNVFANPYAGGDSNCTWTAWQQAYDNTGIALPSWGNAGSWYSSAQAAGYTTSTTPRARSIAVYSGNPGHVAYVAEYNSGSGQIYVKEGGYLGGYHEGWTPIQPTYNGALLGFIYLGSASTPPDGPTGSVVDIKGSVYSIHSAINNNLVVDVADGKKTNGTNIQTQNYHGGPAQRFHIVNGGGYYTIQAQCSDLFVDTEGNSSVSGANIFTWDWTGATGQKWEFVDAGDGYYYIRSKNGMYLDVTDGINSIQVNIQSCRYFGGPAQKWKLVEEKRTVNVEEGVYSIHSAINNNLVVDVADGKRTNGTNIQTQNYHGGSAQRFKVIKKGDYYAIQAQCSNLLIDTEGNSTQSGANIFTWSDTGAYGQRWQFIDAGEGYYFIQSRNEMFVDMTDGVNSIQTNIQSCRFFGGPAQRWKLVREHEHSLVRYPYKEATSSAAGNIEYWKCSSCSKVFKDALGNVEISISDTVILKKQDTTGGGQTDGGSNPGSGSNPSSGNNPSSGSNPNSGSNPSSQFSQTTPTKVKEPITINKVPSSVKAKAKKNKVTVSWKKIKKNKSGKKLLKQIKSIQVQYSTDPKFKQNVKTKMVGKKKTKVKLKLQKKTTYYIRVRYKGSNGFSKWSKVRRVKTKK